MKLFTILTAFAAAVSAAALPEPVPEPRWACIPQWKAEKIVSSFIEILQHPDIPAANATAQALLADDFQEISDSILSLEGAPVRSKLEI
jgi:hypothetical protein